MFYDNGNEVTDQTTKNKVEVNMAYLDGNLRISLYNEAEYFVLSDNRIIKADKTDKGKETIKDPKIIMSILEKATPFKKNCP